MTTALDKTKQIEADNIEDLCKWVDGFQLSRIKRDLNRDFSDGCLVAEIISKFHPSLINLHNYVPCSETKLKVENWNTLRSKVFRKIGVNLSNAEIDNLANWRANAIESFLSKLRDNLETKKQEGIKVFATPPVEQGLSGLPLLDPAKLINTLGEEFRNTLMNGQEGNIIDREIDHNNEDLKEVFVYYKRTTELEDKMNQLKQTLKSKDRQIKDIESMFITRK